MIHTDIPGWGALTLRHLLLDINGTLTAAGALLPGVPERLAGLGQVLEVQLLTADTRGTAAQIAESLGVAVIRVPPGEQAQAKADVAQRLGSRHTVAIGNGAVDAKLLAEAELGIVVVGAEGAATSALLAADVVVTSIDDALDLLLDPQRLVATLRR